MPVPGYGYIDMDRGPVGGQPADTAPGRLRGDRGRRAIGLLVAAIALLLDQATKHLALNLLQPPGREVELPGPLALKLVFNPGGAFGLPLPTWVFLGVTVAVIAIVARNLPHVPSDGQAIAYGLLLAGALGNAADRVFRAGRMVVDFLQLPRWPVFNVADVAITCGFVLLVVLLLGRERSRDAVA